MLPTTFFISFAMAFSFILLLAIYILSDRYLLSRMKMTSFECGFDPKESGRLPFSIRFFLLAVVFLIFDIEVVLLFPLVFGIKLKLLAETSIAGLGFLVILTYGLLHEWREGALSWVL